MSKVSQEEKERKSEQRRIERYNSTHKMINGIDHKICNKCNEYKPSNEEFFYKNKSNKTDGLHPYCKTCTIRDSVQWGKDNRELKYEQNRRYNQTDRNKELHKIRVQRYIESGGRSKWVSENKDKLSEYRQNHRDHEMTKQEWISCKSYFDFRCAYCGISEEEHKRIHRQQLHKEHVKHDGENDLSNCIPSCKNCNSQKYTYELEEWYNEENERFTIDRLNLILRWLNDDYKSFVNN